MLATTRCGGGVPTTTTTRRCGRRKARTFTKMTPAATSGEEEDSFGKDFDAGDPLPPKKSDPFGFDSGRNEGPVPIIPGFDTAEGGKVGPLGTAGISLLLFVLIGGSLFFTSVRRGAVEDVAKMAPENDPDAPVNVLRR